MTTAGVLLAGGLGSRMKGSVPKPLIEIGGRSIAQHVLERLSPFCDPILVSANEAAFAGLGLPVVADRFAERLGPLAGLDAAANFLDGFDDVSHLLAVPGDTPFLPADLAPRLIDGASRLVRVATLEGRLHPTVALWPLAALSALGDLPSRVPARLSIRSLLETVGFEIVEFEADPLAPGSDPFFNVNTPRDLATARSALEIAPRRH